VAKEKNKIVFVANSKWYINNFRLGTLISFNKSNYENYIVTREDEAIKIDSDIAYLKSIYIDGASTNLIKEASTFLGLFCRLLLLKPNIVFSFNPKTNLYSLICSKILRTHCVINISGVGQASQLTGLLGFIYSSVSKYFYKTSTHCFFQNSDDMLLLRENGYVCKGSSELLPGSGVDLNKFSYNSRAKRKQKFLMSSRLIKQKGVEEYLIASSALSDMFYCQHFLLAGVRDLSARAVSDEVISKYCSNKNVLFLGARSDMPEVLKEVDCVVLPSYYPEGTPRSLLEAAASGKVIITTDTPGCRDVVIEGVNGFLVPPRDTEALKEAMAKVINLSDEKLAEMQANSRKLAEEKFDEQYVIQRYLDVAEEILAKKSK